MIIKIEQSFLSFKDKYAIYLNDVLKYRAKSSFFQLPGKTNLGLYNLEDYKYFSIQRLSPFYFEYNLLLDDETTIEIRVISGISFHYSFEYENSKFEIFGHTGRKFSIFQNNIQIAWFEKALMVDFYELTTNENAPIEILIGFILAFDIHYHPDSNFYIDLGNIGRNLKPFNESWLPK